MMRDALIASVAVRLGQRQDLVPAMEGELNIIQETVLESHHWLPWFLETELAWTDVVVGEERVPLPTDFLREIEDQALWLRDSSGELLGELPRKAYDDLLRTFPLTGRPKAYSTNDAYFFLRPVADQAYQVAMRYYAKEPLLTADGENKWLKHAPQVVMYELASVMAGEYMQYPELATLFQGKAQQAWDRLYRKHISVEEDNRSRVMEG